ncbi:hypothetical protein METBIDRAFT_37745 [Metschnikowia bicuspidata var. bicuspidata NRRL YB-4993]|uniref:Mitochondrial import inner membrane translocase subunit TIM54 n=1 Tax=Metschnikowia bicuspidata var. bicuspidata NRRL YB-4993 TaxID=869754 RepID=A0A1A0HHV2_9ASCO|nr:hypothetical protein METBIDRAFT_37745 [Metschnikowia bicuspidata var. bicuspidata NRRL YB-4993]OBA23739.1 hypothetical protein METBIDRAFT_37745 [Metschnikowia bicuspidata var. bicuspidata NRRL YB-4993]
MSDGNKPAAPSEPAKPAKKSWSNPALRAMGIPRVSLPSRNWMIFWTLLASVSGGIYYDKQQQKAIRQKYMKQVEALGQETYTTGRLPRKLSIFIAPPPDDFLDESLRHFRHYIKPILNAAAIDFEVYTENRQGDIRSQVAEKIRQLRRDQNAARLAESEELAQQAYEKSWSRFFRESVPLAFARFKRKEPEPETYVARHELYGPTDVLGLYKVAEPVTPHRDFEDDALLCGGVICIGRGTYKEYINGVHEGLLGPLEKPAEVVLNEKPQKTPEVADETKPAEIADFAEKEGEAAKKENPVPKPYILPGDYASGQLAPELDFNSVIRNKDNVPVIFEQPLYVFPIPKLTGFRNMPRKIYRYFTRRELAEEVSAKTMYVVDGHSRKFEFKDQFLGKEEEVEWPKKWVERGKEKKSEWVQELEVDERVTSRMRVYDSGR